MIAIGNFLFRYRNGLFPLVYALLLLRSPRLLPDDRAALILGLLVAIAGQALRAITIGLEYIVRGGRNRQVYAEGLVQGGVFAHCRNPLYVGNYLIVVGVGLASNSLLFVAVAIPFFAFSYWAIIAAEENYLRKKFGPEFDAYCARVNRVVPDFSGFSRTIASMRFNWRRLIVAEYGSTYLWTAAITLVTLKNAWRNGHSEDATIWALCIIFIVVTVGYTVARVLKKSGRLEENPAQA